MSDVHLGVFLDYLLVARLRHSVDGVERCRQVHDRRKAEASLRDVHVAHLAGEVVDVLKEVAVDCGESGEGSDLERVEEPLLEQFERAHLGEPLLLAGKLEVICYPQPVLEHS